MRAAQGESLSAAKVLSGPTAEVWVSSSRYARDTGQQELATAMIFMPRLLHSSAASIVAGLMPMLWKKTTTSPLGGHCQSRRISL